MISQSGFRWELQLMTRVIQLEITPIGDAPAPLGFFCDFSRLQKFARLSLDLQRAEFARANEIRQTERYMHRL